jgi:hypothetical protein
MKILSGIIGLAILVGIVILITQPHKKGAGVTPSAQADMTVRVDGIQTTVK